MELDQFLTIDNMGTCRDPIVIVPDKSSVDYSLPESYTSIPAATSKVSDLSELF